MRNVSEEEPEKATEGCSGAKRDEDQVRRGIKGSSMREECATKACLKVIDTGIQLLVYAAEVIGVRTALL